MFVWNVRLYTIKKVFSVLFLSSLHRPSEILICFYLFLSLSLVLYNRSVISEDIRSYSCTQQLFPVYRVSFVTWQKISHCSKLQRRSRIPESSSKRLSLMKHTTKTNRDTAPKMLLKSHDRLSFPCYSTFVRLWTMEDQLQPLVAPGQLKQPPAAAIAGARRSIKQATPRPWAQTFSKCGFIASYHALFPRAWAV